MTVSLREGQISTKSVHIMEPFCWFINYHSIGLYGSVRVYIGSSAIGNRSERLIDREGRGYNQGGTNGIQSKIRD